MIRTTKHAHYAPGFKQRATALAREIGFYHAAPKLGIQPGTLRKWLKNEDKGMLSRYGKKQNTPEEAAVIVAETEIRRLKRENEELKKANFILKEVASFFSKDRLPSNLRRSLNSPNGEKKKGSV